MASSDQHRFRECHQNWMTQQQEDLEELMQVFNPRCHDHNEKIIVVVNKIIKHFEDYHQNRTRLAESNAPAFFSPTWCTSIENSYLWLGGCRPSLFIRLVYSLCGSQLESQLSEYLQGVRKGDMADLSAAQISLVSGLQCRTIREEEKLGNKMASLQEDVADEPLSVLANTCSNRSESSSSEQVDQALDTHARALVKILDDADKLRLNTFKELIGILTPLQAIEYLIASKKLHLCIHEWSKRRDVQLGST